MNRLNNKSRTEIIMQLIFKEKTNAKFKSELLIHGKSTLYRR